MGIGDRIQSADWRKEKHVPVIDCPDAVRAGEPFQVKVGLGREIAHPNTTEHHISWVSLFFHPEGDKFSYDIGRFNFNAHGESVAGPNQGPVYTHHEVTTTVKIDKPGTLHAVAMCNIHGLWESAKEIAISE
jgi:superoxide reductase